MALGAEYKEIDKIWKDIYGTKAPVVKDMKNFVSHIANELSEKTDAAR
jgi:hypothetical protein